jgi:membrane protein implicated in regulation of membrane protease activity
MIKIILIVILSIIALILTLVGTGFFISALYFYFLSLLHTKTLVALCCGGSFLVIAILLLLFAMIIKSTLFKVKIPKKLQQQYQSVKEDPTGEALNLVKHYPFRTLAAALTSGLILGFFPKVRDSLIEGVSTYLKTGSVADSLKSLKSDNTEDQE